MTNSAANMQARRIATFHLPVEGGTPFERPGSNLPYMPAGIHMWCALLPIHCCSISPDSEHQVLWVEETSITPAYHSSAYSKQHATVLITYPALCIH